MVPAALGDGENCDVRSRDVHGAIKIYCNILGVHDNLLYITI